MQMVKLKDGLYFKQFKNGVVMVDGKPFTLADGTKMSSFIRIENGKPYLANASGNAVTELVPVGDRA